MSRPTTGFDFLGKPNTARPHPQSRFQCASARKSRKIWRDLLETARATNDRIRVSLTHPLVTDEFGDRRLRIPQSCIGQTGTHLDTPPKRSYHQRLSL